ncbi:hypothetical protein E3P94_01236 [Wallemia ichthyophaga]|nr:hypothetical protein E3P95_01104 [Wallemia ichthyophaga]TIB02941.1 hypothetical protein E3P94_01236 [Wallemia ichthyophaga]
MISIENYLLSLLEHGLSFLEFLRLPPTTLTLFDNQAMEPPKITIETSPNSPQPSYTNDRRNSESLAVPTTSKDPFTDDNASTSYSTPSAPSTPPKKKKKEKKEKKPLEPRRVDNLGAFAFQPHILTDCVGYKQFDTLRDDIGGIDGLARGLGTDLRDGLRAEAYSLSGKPDPSGPPQGRAGSASEASGLERQRVYDKNEIPPKETKNFFQLMWMAMEDKLLQLLIVAAIVALALGIYQAVDFPAPVIRCYNDATGRYDAYCTEPQVEWVEGVAILIAIIIVVLVGSINDYQKELQFMQLNKKKEDRDVKVKRDGNEQHISIKDVLVGDILQLETGDILPVDGVFIGGHNIKADESAATGESDAIKKVTFDDYSSYLDTLSEHDKTKSQKKDCFLLSGSKITEGVGEMIVVAVGLQSYNGRILASLNDEDDEGTPLQSKLNDLAELIAKVASVAGLLLFIALMIRFFVGLKENPDRTPREKGQNFIEILIISVTLIVVAVPEGLPLAVTLALAFATKRMTKANLLVRLLASCETMANATAVCTDKTGTLTQNVMSVVAGTIGINAKFVIRLEENAARSNADQLNSDEKYTDGNFTVDSNDLSNHIKGPLRKLLFDSIAINSTAFEDKNKETGEIEFVGSKTETALLRFAKERQWDDWRNARESAEIAQMIPFSSARKAMGMVVKLSDGHYRLYVKGASEVLAGLATKSVSIDETDSEDIPVFDMSQADRESLNETIKFYATQSLRTIALCYKDFAEWPPKKASIDETGDVEYDSIAMDLTLVGITGIEDPLRPGVSDAVKRAQMAGVKVKMCTGDNVLTAQSIARQCGILTEGGIVMEGVEFRNLSEYDRISCVPNLQVLARSSPDDKKMLVQTLRKSHSETVGVTGDGTNDAPALKAANVGFSMGIAGTEVAKEASSIILMDDNFASIVSAIMWGRCVNDSVKKFLQFQLSVNVTAILIVFVTAIASDSEESVLSAVQLLWVNLIMDTFAALALATDPATPTVLNRKPEIPGSPIINASMLKVITSQSLYKTAVVFVLHFAGRQILGYRTSYTTDEEAAEFSAQGTQLKSLVFNAFVWCQIFNQINCRRLDNKLNVFEGIHKNWWFIVMFCIMVGGQVLIIFVGGAAFSVTRLGGRDWAISVICGFCSLIIGALFRFIPDEPIERKLTQWGMFPDPHRLPINMGEPSKKGEDPIYDSLQLLSMLRGGRIRGSSVVQKSRRIVRHPIQELSETLYPHSKTNSGTTTPDNGSTSPLSAKHTHLDALSVLPMMVASSVGAGPIYRNTRSGSVNSNSNSRPGHSPSTSIDDHSSAPPSPLSHKRQDERMPRSWEQYASISMDEGSYESGLSNFENIRCPGYLPSENYIQQFVYISLVPTVRKSGDSNSGVGTRGRSKKQQQPHINTNTNTRHDTVDVAAFDEKMASSSLRLLTRLLEMQSDSVFEDSGKDHLEIILNALPSYRRTMSVAHKHAPDTVLEKGAAEVNKCRCIWDLLGMNSRNKSERKNDINNNAAEENVHIGVNGNVNLNLDGIIDQDAWAFFGFVVSVWEMQARNSQPTHLMANLRDVRYDASSALDAVLAGFEAPTKLSPLSCSPSVGIRVRENHHELLAAKMASESIQRVDISKRLLRLLLQLVVDGTLAASAVLTHLGSQLSLREGDVVCDVMDAFPVEYTDIMLDVMVAVIQAKGELVTQGQTPIMKVLLSSESSTLKAIGLRNAIIGKSPSVDSVRESREELQGHCGKAVNVLLALL